MSELEALGILPALREPVSLFILVLNLPVQMQPDGDSIGDS